MLMPDAVLAGYTNSSMAEVSCQQLPTTGHTARQPTIVLFACVHNAGGHNLAFRYFQIPPMVKSERSTALDTGRSQMANAWFNALADHSKAQSISAGTQPLQHVHPEVQTVMKVTPAIYYRGDTTVSVLLSRHQQRLTCQLLS